MSLVLVCICTLSVSKKSLAQETTDSATYAGSTSVKAYVTGSSENEQENHPEDEEHLQDESTTKIWIAIWIFSMLVFGCGIKYKKVTNK